MTTRSVGEASKIADLLEAVAKGDLDPADALDRWPDSDSTEDRLIADAWHALFHYRHDADLFESDPDYRAAQASELLDDARAIRREYQETAEIARAAFTQVQEWFPDLTMRRAVDAELALEIPAQPGLLFDVHLLSDLDERHLRAGGLHAEWLPSTEPSVVADFLEAVSGLLAGEWRICEYRRRGQTLKAHLQHPRGSGWKTIRSYYRGFHLLWTRAPVVVHQNSCEELESGD